MSQLPTCAPTSNLITNLIGKLKLAWWGLLLQREFCESQELLLRDHPPVLFLSFVWELPSGGPSAQERKMEVFHS